MKKERLRDRRLRAQPCCVGRHYPNLRGDPVRQHGYYYSPSHHKLARLKPGDRLPHHMAPWEFLAADEEGSSSEILQRLLDRYPNLDPYRLTYATSTPVDPRHLVRSRSARKIGYGAVFAAMFALAWLAGWLGKRGFPDRRQKR